MPGEDCWGKLRRELNELGRWKAINEKAQFPEMEVNLKGEETKQQTMEQDYILKKRRGFRTRLALQNKRIVNRKN